MPHICGVNSVCLLTNRCGPNLSHRGIHRAWLMMDLKKYLLTVIFVPLMTDTQYIAEGEVSKCSLNE